MTGNGAELLLILAVALAACVQATAGMGFALILSPVLLVALTPETAIVLVTALGLTLNVLVLFSRGRRPDVAWAEVSPMLVAAVPGSVCGLLVLRSLPKPALEIGVGTIVVGLMLMRLLPARAAGAGAAAAAAGAPPSRSRASRAVTLLSLPGREPGGRLAVGALAGALSTASGVNGPPLALWLSGRSLHFTTIRDSLATCFLGMGVISAITLIPTLSGVHLNALILGSYLAAVVAGHAIGSRLHPRLGAERLQRLLSLIILASGASALFFGLTAL